MRYRSDGSEDWMTDYDTRWSNDDERDWSDDERDWGHDEDRDDRDYGD